MAWKDIVQIREGVTIARTTTGHIIATDEHGTTKALNGPDEVQWFFYTAKGEFPEPPRLCFPEEAIERQKRREEDLVRKAEEDRNTAMVKMADGTERRVRIDQLQIPRA